MEFYYRQSLGHFACTGCQEQGPEAAPVGEDEQRGAQRLWSEAVARWAREGL